MSSIGNPFIPEYDDPPAPPPVIYKYLAPERIDVLERARIRFTPLLGTNDVFEVRQTFDLIAGPKLRAAMLHEAQSIDVDESVRKVLDELGIPDNQDGDLGRTCLTAIYGPDYRNVIGRLIGGAIDQIVIPQLNAAEAVDKFFTRLGGDMLALSLTESPDNPVMWAHYAASSRGFVVAFDTASSFFHQGSEDRHRALQQISYFDGKVDELMDDPRAALISKTTAWEYEREWRLYIKLEEAQDVIDVGGEAIHLCSFPTNAVSRVIAGPRISAVDLTRIQAALTSQYPNVSLVQMVADRAAATLTEVEIT